MAKEFSIWRSAALAMVLLAATCTLTPSAQAQSLEEQYAYYLSAKCTRLNFDRVDDDIPNDVAPGQAGPQLDAYCSGLPPVGGGIDASSAGTATAGSMSRNDDEALRRRQATARDGKEQAGGDEFDILTTGRNSVFASFNYAREDQKARRFEGGRRADLLALTVGVDRRLGTMGLVGLAGGIEDQSGELDAGGSSDSRGYSALLYASWTPASALFIDWNGGAAWRSAETHRVVSFTRTLDSGNGPAVIESIAPSRADSKVAQQEWRSALLAGYDLALGGSSIGPRLAAEFRHAAIDGTVEGGASPMALVIDEQVEKSLRGGLGLQASHVFNGAATVFVIQLNADWWHEFQDDQRRLTARFAQDLRDEPVSFQYQNQPPDRDTFTARASLVASMPRGFSAFLALDGLFGHSYLDRYGVALGVRKEL